MPASADIELEILKAYLAGVAPTKPTNLWLALCEEEPARTATSESLPKPASEGGGKELAYPGYSRTLIKCEAASWEFVAGTVSAIAHALNKSAVSIQKVTGTNEKNKAAYYALVMAEKFSEPGKMVFYGALGEVLEIIKALAKVEFAVGALEAGVE